MNCAASAFPASMRSARYAARNQPNFTRTRCTAPSSTMRSRKGRSTISTPSISAKQTPRLDPGRIVDRDFILRGLTANRHLERRPTFGNAGVEMQESAADAQPENALYAGALHPTRRARVPRPAAPPDMGRACIDVGRDDIGLHFVAMHVRAGSRMIDGVEQREQVGRLIAFAERGEGHHRP